MNHIEKLIPSKKELEHVYLTANEISKKNKIRISSNVCMPLCVINQDDYPDIHISTCSDDVRHRPLTIDFEGNVRTCNHSPVIMGNVYKEDMQSILNSEYAQSWSTQVPEFCNECKKWD